MPAARPGALPPGRLVVLLCGPAGAGKTTAAKASGLTVYDRDDPQWPDERTFKAGLARLRADPVARAVAIRSAASSSARASAAALVGATHVYLLVADRAELGRRVAHRNREDVRHGLASIRTWFADHDRNDEVAPFPGWPAIGPRNCIPGPPPVARTKRPSSTGRGYDWAHQQERARWQKRMDRGELVTCRSLHCRCGQAPVDRHDWHLGHTDDRRAWTGPENPLCNLSAAGTASAAMRARGRPSREW